MKNLEFDGIDLENFKSFASGPHRFNLQRKDGLYFLCGRNEEQPRLGSNGAGKSTVWDAMSWCLYGRTVNDLHNPDIKPWAGGKTSTVSVWVTVDGLQKQITRTARPNSLSINGDEKSQEDVEALIGMNQSVFCNTIVLGQGQPLFFDLKPAAKMQLLVDVLSLDRWDARAATASARTVELNSKLSRRKGELEILQGQLEVADRTRVEVKRRHDEWESSRQEKLKAAEAAFDEWSTKSERVQKELDQASLAYDEVSTEGDKLHEQLATAEASLGKAQKKVDDYEFELRDTERKLEFFEKQLADLDKAKTCPTCGQPIKAKNTASHRDELLEKIKPLRASIKKGIPSTVLDPLKKQKEKVKQLVGLVNSFDEKARKLQHKRDLLVPLAAEAVERFRSASRDREQERDATNPHTEHVQTIRRQLSDLRARVTDVEQRVKVLGRRLERTKFWIKGFKDVRLDLVDELLQELQLVSNAMLEEVGLIGWSVVYQAERETASGNIQRGLNVLINSPANDDVTKWESWSGGEGQRLRLIGALALSEVLLNYAGVQINLEVLDEPTQHLSPRGVHDLCEFLSERAKQVGRQIWYVDHTTVESARFSGVATVVKTKAGSKFAD